MSDENLDTSFQTAMSFSSLLPDDVLTTLKRRSSPACDGQQDGSRKRQKGATDDISSAGVVNGNSLANDLAEELHCGCCSDILYRPVVVSPCQHHFCGRYESEFGFLMSA